MKKYIYMALFLLTLCVPAIAGTIHSYTLKSPPDDADEIVIYDSDDGSTKKIEVGDISGGSVSGSGINWTSYPDLTALTSSQEFLINNAGTSSSLNWEVLQTQLPSTGWSDAGTNVYNSTTTDTVGIGTTEASATLEIVKQGSSTPLMVSGSATGDGNYLLINSGGNVGVGTVSPRGKFDVNGQMYVGSSGTGSIASTSGFGFDVNNDSVNDINIDSSSNVGIGTASPLYSIDINTTGIHPMRLASTISNSANNAPNLIFQEDDGTALSSGDLLGKIVFAASNDTAHTILNSVSIEAKATNSWSGSDGSSEIRMLTTPSGTTTRSEQMRITGDGVGIGTTVISGDTLVIDSPSVAGSTAAFKIYGNASNTSMIIVDEPAAAKARLRLRNSSTTAIQFDVNSNSYINTGNFGVGTTIPSDSLQVLGGSIRAAGYKSSDGTAGVTVTSCTGFKNGLCISGT